MTNRAPATPEQLSELAASLTRLHFECDTLLDLVSTIYGAKMKEPAAHKNYATTCSACGGLWTAVTLVQFRKEEQAVPSRQ